MTQRIAMVSVDLDLVDLLQTMTEFELVGVFDRKVPDARLGLIHLGSDEQWSEFSRLNPDVGVVMGLDPCSLKRQCAMQYGIEQLVTVRAASSYVSRSAILGHGTVVQRSVTISAGVRIGQVCKLNMGATVHHDCVVGDFSTLAPGARLLGNVTVGDGVYIGAGSIVLPRKKIGSGAIVGAGAVVTTDIPENAVVVGIPARARQ